MLFIQLYKLMTHKLMTLRATASEIKTLGCDRNIQIFIYSSLRTENRQVMTEKKEKEKCQIYTYYQPVHQQNSLRNSAAIHSSKEVIKAAY